MHIGIENRKLKSKLEVKSNDAQGQFTKADRRENRTYEVHANYIIFQFRLRAKECLSCD